jgi:hypothetical protein
MAPELHRVPLVAEDLNGQGLQLCCLLHSWAKVFPSFEEGFMEHHRRPFGPVSLILLPMVLTFVTQRLVLHHSSPDTHVFVAGFLVHHLFSGVLILVPTAFALALGIKSALKRNVALVTLGFSSAMVLDEVIYLVCTDGTGTAYRGAVSFWGAVVLLTLAAIFLVGVQYGSGRCSKTVNPES